VRDPKAKPRKRYDGTASWVISTGVFVALEALPFQIISDFGDLGEGGFHIGNSRNETSLCPSSLTPFNDSTNHDSEAKSSPNHSP
jgi:hypothetical protein